VHSKKYESKKVKMTYKFGVEGVYFVDVTVVIFLVFDIVI
jgi:hypothetical protein